MNNSASFWPGMPGQKAGWRWDGVGKKNVATVTTQRERRLEMTMCSGALGVVVGIL